MAKFSFSKRLMSPHVYYNYTYYVLGATLLNPPKIKLHIADFLYPPRGFKGDKPPKNVAPFDFLTPKGTDAESSFENGPTYLSQVRKK